MEPPPGGNSMRLRTKTDRVQMSESDPDRFRKQAKECRLQAEKAVSPLDKEAWLRVPGDWIKLAQAIDDRGGR
jgi:hypothetical protein